MDEQFKNIQEARAKLRQLLDDYKRITKDDTRLFNPQNVKTIEEAGKKANALEKIIIGAKREARGLSGAFSQMLPVLQANVAEISKINNATNNGKRAYSQLVKVVRELADEEESITNLSLKQIKVLDQRAKSEFKQLQASAEQLSNQHNLSKLSGLTLYSRLRQLKIDGEITEAEFSLLRAKQQNFAFEKLAVTATENRLQLERKVLDNLKLTGGALQGLGNLAASLGLSGFSESLNDISTQLEDDIRKKIRKTAEESAKEEVKNMSLVEKRAYEITSVEQERLDALNKKVELGEELSAQEKKELNNLTKKNAAFQKLVNKHIKLVKSAGTLNAKFKALGKAAKEIGKQLSDPLFILGSMAKGFMAIDESATAFQRTTGQNVRVTAALNSSLVTSAENIEMMSKFAEQTGMNINDIFNSYDLARITEAGKLLGVGAEGAAQLAQNIELSGVPLNEFQDAALQGGKEIVAAGAAGINLGKVLQDASTASGAIALSLGNNPVALARASAEAQRLGMSLDQIDGIANSMLDFETSIQNELEAQLLTGKNINLAKAREAALNNDLAGLAKEIRENNALSNTFSTSNRIQQESMAKALGMSRDDLAKMVALEKLREGVSLDTVSSQMKISKEQLLQMSVQDKFNTAIGKLQQALGPIIDAFTGILDIITPIVSGIGQTFAFFSNLVNSIKDGINELFGFNEGVDRANDGFTTMERVLKTIGNVVGGILITRFLGLTKLVGKLGISFKTMSRTIGSIPRMLVTLRSGLRSLTGKGVSKTIESVGKSKAGQNVASKGAGAILKKIGGKGAAKLGGKALGKLLPGVGLAFALNDFMEGDITGGIINTLAGIASFFPGIGTAISGILTAVDLGRELYNASTSPTEMAKGGVITKATNVIAGEAGPEAIIPLSKLPGMMGGGLSLEGLNVKFDEMISKLDELTNIKGDVYIDGNKTGQAIFSAATNLS